ncbi:MAG: DUF5119 domain-containing protein [Bacteroidales bacterium]|nr:DUF5119 domain-containing protein [Bacteroidales bacterium]
MRSRVLISVLAALLLVSGCTIEPQLRLRKVATTKVVMQTKISTDIMWQVNWQTAWDFDWKTEVYGPVGYTEPKGIRMHIYTLDDTESPKSHYVYNFSGNQGQADVFVGIHNLLFHNNDSEVLLFRSEDDLADIYSYTRIISKGLKSSIPVQTTEQKIATKADDDDEETDLTEEIDEPVAFAPDELFVMFEPKYHVTDDLNDYEYIDGQYVLRIEGDLIPHSFIYLFQIRLLNNLERVYGSSGAALTGMAESVNLRTGETSSTPVCVPMDVHINTTADPDLMGARVLGFGIPGCNPYDAASVAATESKHWLVLNVMFKTGKYKNIRIDVTDQIRALPTGGVIPLEIDVEDFPEEDTDPPIDEGDGFKPLIGGWNEETGSTTIIS